MALVIFDCETTSLSGDVVELGSVIITQSGEKFHFNERCKPIKEPISEGAFKCHGISNEDVEDCRPSHQVVAEWFQDLQDLNEDLVFCAHNAAFDRRILSQHVNLNPYKHFCSLTLAKHRYPEAPNHKLTTLYEELGFTEEMKAHSALDDCIMLERILERLMGNDTIYDIVNEQLPKMLTEVTFGKHSGKKFVDLPDDYLVWCRDKHSNRNVAFTAGELLGRR